MDNRLDLPLADKFSISLIDDPKSFSSEEFTVLQQASDAITYSLEFYPTNPANGNTLIKITLGNVLRSIYTSTELKVVISEPDMLKSASN